MLAKVKKVITTDLAKVSFLNAISVFVKMVASFTTVKIVAEYVGPKGIALLGQLSNMVAILLSLSTGGISSGITRYVAQHKNSPNRFVPYLRTGFWITVFLSLILGAILIAWSGYFSTLILKDIQYKSVFVVFGCTIIMYALNTFLLSIINGKKEFRLYVLLNIVSSICGLIFSVLLAINFGIYGALIAAVSFQSVVFIVTLVILLHLKWFTWSHFTGRFSKLAALRLSHYSVMELVTAATLPVSQLIIRDHLVRHETITDAGLWEAMNRISGMYLLMITASLSVYFLPRLAELKTRNEIREEIFNTYKLVLPALSILLLLIFVFKGLIIKLVFTEEFANMENLFIFQLTGDFFKIAGWILACQLVAKAMTRTYIITEVLFRLLFVGLGIFFINAYGTIGATIAYAAMCFLYFLTMVMIFNKTLFTKSTRF